MISDQHPLRKINVHFVSRLPYDTFYLSRKELYDTHIHWFTKMFYLLTSIELIHSQDLNSHSLLGSGYLRSDGARWAYLVHAGL